MPERYFMFAEKKLLKSIRWDVGLLSIILVVMGFSGCEPTSEHRNSPHPSTRNNASNSGLRLDRAKWTKHLIQTGIELAAIAFSGKEYVVVGSGGSILRSTDLQHWQRTAPGSKTDLTSIAWLNSRFYVGGNEGIIMESVDGRTWSRQRQSGKGIVYDFEEVISPLNTSLVAVAAGGEILLSPEGSNWMTIAKINSVHPFAIAWSGDTYVSVGMAKLGDRQFSVNGGAILTSHDLVNWNMRSMDDLVRDVIWTGNQFVAVGPGGMFFSSDGMTWQRVQLPPGYARQVAWIRNTLLIITDEAVFTGTVDNQWKQHRPEGIRKLRQAIWTGEKLVVLDGDSVWEASP